MVFDMSRVEKLCGPWGSHFAALANLSLGLSRSVRIEVTGLHGQPLAVASIFRHCRAIQDLFRDSPGVLPCP